MEQLTKQQIVLVTLLVSFVTSIATGIVTVALMDQAPPGVTQTINRVVERTIEKVVTPPAGNSAAVVTKETVVVKEDDKVSEAVDMNKNSVVRIYTNNKNEESQQSFIGLGTIVSKDGLIATGDIFADIRGKFLVTVDNNKFYSVTVLPKKEGNRLYFLRVVETENTSSAFTPVLLANSDNLKLGQTVIAWGGQKQNAIFPGIVSSLNETDLASSTATSTEIKKNVLAINTNINLADSLSGGPLLNLNGEMVGIRVVNSLFEAYNFLPANIIKQEMAAY